MNDKAPNSNAARAPLSSTVRRLVSPSQAWTFSVPRHTAFLAGYMDAVGRALSTDTELVALSARGITGVAEAEEILGVSFGARTAVDNWSREFGGLVENLLGTEQRSRLGFYLIDYICWFREFGSGAACFKVECDLSDDAATAQAVYLIELRVDQRVLIVAKRGGKSSNTSLERTPEG